MGKCWEFVKTLVKIIFFPYLCIVQVALPLYFSYWSSTHQERFWNRYSRILGNWREKIILDMKATDGVCEAGYHPEFAFAFSGTFIR